MNLPIRLPVHHWRHLPPLFFLIMVKAYLRYEPERSFGVICSTASNSVFSKDGAHLICAALEDILLWNIKKGGLSRGLRLSRGSNDDSLCLPQVTRLELSPDGGCVCAGYSDGSIRFWVDWECKTVLTGHKGAVSALRFSKCGSWLASGGNDTDVCVWDVVGERGVCKLKGHKGQVTDVVFLKEGKVLVSASKDSILKVWDLDTQHCSQSVVEQRKWEVWSLAVDPEESRIVAGSSGRIMSVFEIKDSVEEGVGRLENLLVKFGGVETVENDRVRVVRFDENGEYLVCQSSAKVVEVFKVESEKVARKKAKKRGARKRKKAEKQGKGEEEAGVEENIVASDLFDHWTSVRCKHKISSFSVRPKQANSKASVLELGLAYRNNSFQVAALLKEASESGDGVEFRHVMSSGGHSSGVRSLALSSDQTMLASSSEKELKLWNTANGSSLHTVPCGYGVSCMFVPGDTYVVVGTKDGKLQIIDVASSEAVEVFQAHDGPIWSLVLLPEEDGFVSAGDKAVKFWKWKIDKKEDSQQQLSISNFHTHTCEEDALCLRISPDGRLLAVALLSCTIKVVFLDSLKLFLTLYGHNLPVLAMDISADNQLLATGSADKNIKIWGLDFGDCHKSIFAHNDSVTHVAFVHTSHYLFSASKDGEVKYWDMDKHELLLRLSGHHAEVWCLAVSKHGDFLFSGSNDRSIRCWSRTDEPFFLEEEKEKRLESMFESELVNDGELRQTEEPTAGPAGQKTAESIGAADSIIDALDMAAHEAKRIKEHKKLKAAQFESNPLLLGLNPSAYVLKVVQKVKPGALEMALLSLPFSDALNLLEYMCEWLENWGSQVETIARVSTLIIRLHLPQLSTSSSAQSTLVHLQGLLRSTLRNMNKTIGFNLAGMQHVRSALKRKRGISVADDLHPLRQKLK